MNGGYSFRKEGTYEEFKAFHEPQLVTSGIPAHFWPRLYVKLSSQLFDAGNFFQIVQIERDPNGEDEDDSSGEVQFQVSVIAENGVSVQDPDCIFLIDHAWTFRPESARDQLVENEGLRERMADLMQIPRTVPVGDLVESILQKIWKYNDHYILGGSQFCQEEKVPIWYILDEFGSRIGRSDEPNVRVVPFFFMWSGEAFSLLFPIKNIGPTEVVSRGYIEFNEPEEKRRAALKLPWVPCDLSNESVEQVDPGEEYFRAMKINESLPDHSVAVKALRGEKVAVYAEYAYVIRYLTDERFHFVNSEEEADILWLSTHFKQFWELSRESPGKRVNQFPYEGVVTVKDLLAVICGRDLRSSGDLAVEWMPKTFNLQTELVQFVSTFQRREKEGLDNHWICKPWNLARSLDTYVSSNLDQIIRLVHTGPKIVQKYIHDPVLFHRPEVGYVKFDIRYIILMRSVKPLKVFMYDKFWLRFANKPFSLDHLDDYEKHFTVMNYSANSELKQMTCDDFRIQFEQQYPENRWKTVEKEIKSAFRRCFEAATVCDPPMGIGHCEQSRAVYAIDLMLSWEDDGPGNKVMRPKILEVNWGPDCQRACEYYPSFYNDIFQVLFLDEVEGKPVTAI